jgi:predicted transcriptional regulator of viral defense system
MSSSTTSLACLAKRSPLLLRKDVLAAGLSSAAITSLTRQGMLIRVGRGLYQLADTEAPNAELVDVSVRQPKGGIVLISALAFHGIGSHRASEIWLQLPINAPTPSSKWPPLRIIRSRLEEAFTEGVETHEIGGHPVRITSLDRTIVDCFKHRSAVGLEVAVEALRERMANRKGKQRSLQNLNRYSHLMRVARVMQPYLEALA